MNNILPFPLTRIRPSRTQNKEWERRVLHASRKLHILRQRRARLFDGPKPPEDAA